MIRQVDYLLPGDHRGVLLIHGLTGTPQEMHLVARGLNQAGFTVYAMQLAGHCGTADDLIATRWRDWVDSVNAAADHLAGQTEVLFAAGLSMGALLSLKLAADRPGTVAGVGVYGATFVYDGWSIPRIQRLSFLLPMLKKLGIGKHRMFEEQPPYGLYDERLRAHILAAMQSGDSTQAGLPGNPWPALAELVQLSRVVRRQLPQVQAPCLIMHARNDDIASAGNAELVQQRISGPSELILLDKSYHMITIDRERRKVIEETARFFRSIAPDRPATNAA